MSCICALLQEVEALLSKGREVDRSLIERLYYVYARSHELVGKLQSFDVRLGSARLVKLKFIVDLRGELLLDESELYVDGVRLCTRLDSDGIVTLDFTYMTVPVAAFTWYCELKHTISRDLLISSINFLLNLKTALKMYIKHLRQNIAKLEQESTKITSEVETEVQHVCTLVDKVTNVSPRVRAMLRIMKAQQGRRQHLENQEESGQ